MEAMSEAHTYDPLLSNQAGQVVCCSVVGTKCVNDWSWSGNHQDPCKMMREPFAIIKSYFKY